MRKYIVRKNFDQDHIDELNAPHRTVFFEKNQGGKIQSAEYTNLNDKKLHNSLNSSVDKYGMQTNPEEEHLSTEAKKYLMNPYLQWLNMIKKD
ncbi:MAG: hypothetical protein ACW9W3_06310 [Candidatus Nitrosopumilus sp. bin_68KS]